MVMRLAYAVLSDAEKRQIYDRYGEAGLNQQGSRGGNPHDIFSRSVRHGLNKGWSSGNVVCSEEVALAASLSTLEARRLKRSFERVMMLLWIWKSVYKMPMSDETLRSGLEPVSCEGDDFTERRF